MTTVIPSAIQLIRSNDQTYMIHLIIIAQQNITLLCDGKRRNIIVHISRSSPQITRFRRNLIYYWWNTRIHLNLSWQSQHTFDGNSNTYIVPRDTNKNKGILHRSNTEPEQTRKACPARECWHNSDICSYDSSINPY